MCPVFSDSLPLLSRPGTPSTNDLPQADIVQDPQAVAVAPVESYVESATFNAPDPAEPEAIITEALMAEIVVDFEPVEHADNTEFSESESLFHDSAAESQESVGPSPLAKPITFSAVVPPTLPPPAERTQSPVEYIPPPVIDSTSNPGAFTAVTDDLPLPDIVQVSQAAASEPPEKNSIIPTVAAIGLGVVVIGICIYMVCTLLSPFACETDLPLSLYDCHCAERVCDLLSVLNCGAK